jgi:hypothetical protein
MAQLHHSGIDRETALQVATIQGIIGDLERTVQILNIDISTEEERVGIFDRSDPAYPILARTLRSRRDNLNCTIRFLAKRLHTITEKMPSTDAKAA